MKRWLLPVILLFCATPLRAQNYPAPIKALIKRGITIMTTLPAPEGFKGYVGQFSGQLTPVYLLPDGRHVTIGVLYDENGRDLTNAAFRAATMPKPNPALWNSLARSTWIAQGPAKARRIVYVFTDTECPYCHELWLAVQPYLKEGRVQMRNVIVAVIAPESLGRGAAVLTAHDPADAMLRHEEAFGHSPIRPLESVAPKIRAEIEANQTLMNHLNAFATPAIVYRDEQGTVHMLLGLPDQETMEAIFGKVPGG